MVCYHGLVFSGFVNLLHDLIVSKTNKFEEAVFFFHLVQRKIMQKCGLFFCFCVHLHHPMVLLVVKPDPEEED